MINEKENINRDENKIEIKAETQDVGQQKEDTVEELTRFLDSFTSFVADFVRSADTDIAIEPGPALPESAQEIDSLIQNIKNQEKDLEPFQESYFDLLSEKVKSIQELKLTTTSDLAEVGSLIVEANQLITLLRKAEAKLKQITEVENIAKVKLGEAMVRESGFKSYEDVDKKNEQLDDEIELKSSEFLGLGKFFNRRKIRDLHKTKSKLYRIKSFEYQQSKHYYNKYEYDLRSAEREIGNAIVEKIKNFSELAQADVEKNKKKQTLKFEPVIIDKINDEYLDEYLINTSDFEEINEELEKQRGVSPTEIAKQKKDIIELIKKSFEIDISRHYFGDEDQEKKEKKEKIFKDLDGLPDKVSYSVRNYISRNRDTNKDWIYFNDCMQNLENEKWQASFKIALKKLKKIFRSSDELCIRDISCDLSEWDFPVLNIERRTEMNYENFDTDRWKIFRSNQEIKSTYNEQALDQYQKIAANKILKCLCVPRDNGKDYSLISKLMDLRSTEAMPHIILDAFRVGGDGGGHYLIRSNWRKNTNETELYKYIDSFSKEEINHIKSLNIPSLTKVIDLIQKNKDNYFKEKIRTEKSDDKYEYQPNPIYNQIQEELEKMSCHYLENGTNEEKLFIIRTLRNLRCPIGSQATALKRLFVDSDKNNDPDLEEEISDLLLSKLGDSIDIEALKLLLESKYSNEAKEKVLNTIALKGEDFSKNLENIEENNYEAIRNIMESFIQEKIEKGDAKEKFIAFNAARNLGLDFNCNFSDILSFFESTSLINLANNNREALIVKLSEQISFSEENSYQLARVIARKYCGERFLNKNSIQELEKFIAMLPVGDIFKNEEKHALSSFINTLSSDNLNEIFTKSNIEVTGENWTTMLGAYIFSEEGFVHLNEKTQKIIHDLFSNENPENRDLCLEKLHHHWEQYLKDENNYLNFEAFIICEYTRKANGETGDLKYISALTNAMNSVFDLRGSSKTTKRTKNEIVSGLSEQEKRMTNGKWRDDDKATFYNVSSSIMKAAPSLYTNFLNLFEVMSPKELKKFAQEIYPLYQANMVVLENDEEGNINPRDLVPIRKRLKAIKNNFENKKENTKAILEKEKTELVQSIKQEFEKRFGLLKIPEILSKEHIRTVSNCVRYLGNMNERDQNKESLIAFYLGLNLNGDWDNFRSGKEIDIAEYFSGEKLIILQDIIEKRKELDQINPEIIGLSFEDTQKFKEEIQEETISNMIGNVQSIDVKLSNAKRGMEDLTDPDIYHDEIDRQNLSLISREGKLVGKTLSKIYAESVGKKIEFSQQEKNIRKDLESIYKISNWTPEKVKETQDRIQVPSLISSVLRKLEEEDVDNAIEKLQAALNPSREVIEIFNSFGEEFKSNSGALAISQDLSYLENIIVKNENRLSAEQKQLLNDYVGAIHDQMADLELIYIRIKEYFQKIKKGAHVMKNDILNNRLIEIEKTLYQDDSILSLTTRVTSNINLIIENMRQCLGCLRKEINNDTNLTFGDSSKFYIMSQGEKERRSIADEIVYFLPIKKVDGSKEMAFVMDRIYDSPSLDVFLAHIKAIFKKYKKLKNKFPKANISILITKNVFSGTGFLEKIQDISKDLKISKVDNVIANIPESALGDHYIEFSNDSNGRYNGEAKISGLRIEI